MQFRQANMADYDSILGLGYLFSLCIVKGISADCNCALPGLEGNFGTMGDSAVDTTEP
jgi:hypothetical protein